MQLMSQELNDVNSTKERLDSLKKLMGALPDFHYANDVTPKPLKYTDVELEIPFDKDKGLPEFVMTQKSTQIYELKDSNNW